VSFFREKNSRAVKTISYPVLLTCNFSGEVVERTGSIFERMDVVLFHEALHKWLLDHPQIGCHELEYLRRPVAGYEERCLGVFVRLRCALVHCPFGAGIFGFSRASISILARRKGFKARVLTLVAAWLRCVAECELLAVDFFSTPRPAAKQKAAPAYLMLGSGVAGFRNRRVAGHVRGAIYQIMHAGTARVLFTPLTAFSGRRGNSGFVISSQIHLD
jgi:hypothetical protein